MLKSFFLSCLLNMKNIKKHYQRTALLLFLILFVSIQVLQAQIIITSTQGNTAATNYSSLEIAFNAINNGIHKGNIQISIQGNTVETNACILNRSGSGNSLYNKINIFPSGGQTRTISAALSPGAALILLNGADSVTINGLANSSGDSLVLINSTNSNVLGTSTITFQSGASNNSILNCKLLGSGISNNAGIITISNDTSTNGVGNDNITISNNLISSSGSISPKFGIYSSTIAGKENDNLVISDNSFYNIAAAGTCAAIYLPLYVRNTIIERNHIFFTNPVSNIGTYYAIYASHATSSYTINDNYIGGSEKFCLGTPTKITTQYSFNGIYVSASNINASNIQGNKIANIELISNSTTVTQAFINIRGGKFFIGDKKGNSIGDSVNKKSIKISNNQTYRSFSAILCEFGSMDTILIKNNTFGGIDISGTGNLGLWVIDVSSNTAKMIIENNTFKNISHNSNYSLICINYRANNANFSTIQQINYNKFYNINTLKGQLRGIITHGTSAWNIQHNEMYNLSTKYISPSYNSNAAVIGIVSGSYGLFKSTIAYNKIYNIKTDTSVSSSAIGLLTQNTAKARNQVNANYIHSISSGSVSGGNIIGISSLGGNYTFSNNIIRLGYLENGNSSTNSNTTLGIFEYTTSDSITNYFHNTVHIGGNGVLNSLYDTHGFLSVSSYGTRRLYNNIFSNTRTNANGTAKNYSIGINVALGSDLRNNVYWTGPNFIAQNYVTEINSLSTFKSIFTSDTFSIHTNPNFINADGSGSVFDLHISPGSTSNALESAARIIPGLNTDFDNDARPGPTNSVNGGGFMPDIGADEFDGTIIIQCTPPIAGNTTANDSIFCNTGTLKFTLKNSIIVGNTNTYQWQKSNNDAVYTDVLNANDSTFTLNELQNDSYFRCIVTCTFGQSSDTSSSFFVKKYNVIFTSLHNDTICETGSATLIANANIGDVYWYDSPISTTPLAIGPSFSTPILTQNKIYYAQAKYLVCESNRVEVRVIIYPLPSVQITQVKDSLVSSSLYTNYEWYKDGNAIQNSNINKIKIVGNGKYKLLATDNNTCTNFSNELNVVLSSVENQYSNLKLYPNPANTTIYIENCTATYFEIIDLQGRSILNDEFSSIISIKDLSPGVYFIKFIDSNKKTMQMHKIVKIDN